MSIDMKDVEVRSSADLAKGLQAYIAKNPQIFGGADIYNIPFENPQARAGLLSAVLTGVIDVACKPVVKKFLVIVPPGVNVEDSDTQAWRSLLATFCLIARREMTADEQRSLRACFQTVGAKDLRTRSVVDIISEQLDCTSIVVTESASYRNERVSPYIPPGASTPLLPEDVWVPQVHSLAVEVVKIVKVRQLYVALDTNHQSPCRKELSDLLCSIDGCGVMGLNYEDDPAHTLAARADQWDVWLREGRLGKVLCEVDALPAALDKHKPYLRIQLLHKAGLFPQALQAIREYLSTQRSIDELTRVKLARIAQDANASGFATEILSPAVAMLNGIEDLESALATAHETGSPALEERVAARLNTIFPGSSALRQRRRRALRAARDYAGVAATYAEEVNGDANAEFYQKLADSFSVSHVPDYLALIASAGENIAQAEAYRMACVTDALARKLLIHAFELATPIPTTQTLRNNGIGLLLQILKDILLHAEKGGVLAVPLEQIQAALLLLIEQLAANPRDTALRFGVASIVQPAVSGTTGIALVATLVLHLVSRPIRLLSERVHGKRDSSWAVAHEGFFKTAFSWLQGEEPVIIGRSILPRSLLTEPADDVVSAISDYLRRVPLESGEDGKDLMLYLALGASVIPHSSDPDFDLELLRLVAGRFAISGDNQRARDLAEQAIINCMATPRRRRLGWFAVADVYNRCHNHLDGLLAAACGLAADDQSDSDHVVEQLFTIARLFRDFQLYDQARTALSNARRLIQDLHISGAQFHRVDLFELQIRYLELKRTTSMHSELEALLRDLARNGAEVLKHDDASEPVAIMLGQLIRHAKNIGTTIPPEAYKVFDELCSRARGSSVSLIAAMSAKTPSAHDLLSLLKASGPARYSGDVGFDMRSVAIVAGRALNSDEYVANATDTSFALELLADRGIAMPCWDEAAEPPPVPQAACEVAEIARSISLEGISVLQVGFDDAGRLIQVNTVDGVLEAPIRGPDDTAESRFRHWKSTYPFGYGIDETSTNLFYTTTADICLPSLPKVGPVIVVADVSFQAFPPNLLYANDEFAGRKRPMAAAPSLAWLKSARTRGTNGDGRLCTWISMAIGNTKSQTLPMIAERLAPTFYEYGFLVDNAPTLPVRFAGASMAVIVAHGGVHPDGQFFQVVSDEGNLRVTAEDLADALRNIDVVILFVCSGGRTDKHPEAITTLGLAKQILDRGCSVVIASPWPLDARVPSHWLPEFLCHWTKGRNVMDANFAANQYVDRMFSQDPARGLAMSVFGNPSVCRKSVAM